MKSVILGVATLTTVLVVLMVGLLRSSSDVDPIAPGVSPRPSVTVQGDDDAEASTSNCNAEPRELPSGASPGSSRSEKGSDGELLVWGDGADRVALLAEIPAWVEPWVESSDLPVDHPQRVSVRGNDGVVIPVGDPPISQIFFAWRDGPCGYTVWVGPGLELDDAIDYASRF
ncbi:MAG: hypothetical protein GEU71_16790 [Actinobacteria bacterium]|nr:hypothetical protein [Actinomycetota bacterium]